MSEKVMTWTAFATACGTFVVVILQGLNIEQTHNVQNKVHNVGHGVNATETEIQKIIEENRIAIDNQKIIILDLEDIKQKLSKQKP